MSNPYQQQDLDFDGTNVDLQNRLRWAANAARERAFWTPERLCLSWMQGTTPDDSDLRWWYRQPIWQRQEWLFLREWEAQRCRAEKRIRRPFHQVAAEFEELVQIRRRQDEAAITRMEAWIREDFLAGRPCSVNLSGLTGFERDRQQANLDEALSRAGIPIACISH